jgi:Zn-dependent protease with chaperone function
MQLCESDPALSALCRAVEAQMAAIPDLRDLEVPVVRLETFDELPEAGYSQVVRDTYAAYRRSERTIFVNFPAFEQLSPPVQQAVMAHEIAHALAHRDSLVETLSYHELGEEVLADYLACSWGFAEGLREERLASYGPEYVEALDQWVDEGAYRREMFLWCMRKNAGLLPPHAP